MLYTLLHKVDICKVLVYSIHLGIVVYYVQVDCIGLKLHHLLSCCVNPYIIFVE